MPTYAKQYFTISDFPVGYQTINGANDNMDAIFDALDAEHDSDAVSLAGYGPIVGHHDAVTIARDVIQVRGSQFTATIFLPNPVVSVLTTGNYVGDMTRIATGTYYVEIIGLTKFWGTTTPTGVSTSKRMIICRSNFPTSSGAPQGISITCYELGTGALVSTDMDFTLTISGNR